MLGREREQFGFLDEEVLSRLVPKDHPLAVIRREIDFSFVTEEAAELYHPDIGRPSYPPPALFRALFLEIWAGLSDVQVCRELGYNLLYLRPGLRRPGAGRHDAGGLPPPPGRGNLHAPPGPGG